MTVSLVVYLFNPLLPHQSKQSSVKMKLLCAQVLKDLLGEGIDVSTKRSVRLDLHNSCSITTHSASSLSQYDKVGKLTADAKFGKLGAHYILKHTTHCFIRHLKLNPCPINKAFG